MDYKHQYESMKKMFTMYQDEVVPGLWEKIKQLEKQVPKWIPVTDRLPDAHGTYLCYYGFNQFLDYMTIGCIDWIMFDKHPHWQHASTGLFVTHWMPLPEPPKENDNEM